MLSCVQLYATPWTVACQTSLSMGFSGQEYWSGLPFPSPGDLPNPGIKSVSPANICACVCICEQGCVKVCTSVHVWFIYSYFPLLEKRDVLYISFLTIYQPTEAIWTKVWTNTEQNTHEILEFLHTLFCFLLCSYLAVPSLSCCTWGLWSS